MPQFQVFSIKELQDNLSRVASAVATNKVIVEVRRYSDTVGFFIPEKLRQFLLDWLEEEELRQDQELVKSCLEGRRQIKRGKGIPLGAALKEIEKKHASKKV